MDFTIIIYRKLLEALIAQGYAFQNFAEFLEHPEPRSIILRHDVEVKYENALTISKIQYQYNIRGTYYFRVLPNHFRTDIIQQIASLGHEIGYHYDDLSCCKGDYDAAIKRFEKNLATLNKIAKVRTICMEGAPLSRFDNRDLWKKYNYHNYNIIGEPYLDLDFDKVLYLSDTGRRWNAIQFSLYDKVTTRFSYTNKSTYQVIRDLEKGKLPDQIMITIHPQRWHSGFFEWQAEMLTQWIKNWIKFLIIKNRSL